VSGLPTQFASKTRVGTTGFFLCSNVVLEGAWEGSQVNGLIKKNQGEEPLDTGGGRVFSLAASFGLLATASASALALFLGSALSFCGVSCMI